MISEMAVSNIVGHNMYCSVTVMVSLENNEPAGDARVFLCGKDYSYQYYSGQDSVNVTIDSVMKGHYLIAAYNTGYDSGYIENAFIFNDTSIEIQLLLKKYQVFDLTVDSVSLIATWSKPGMVAIFEDFEGEQFPPPGWQLSAYDPYGDWIRTLDGSSGGFLIPPGDGHYACDNNDAHGTDNHNGCCDYLITPPLDLTERDNYKLDFNSFYNGAYGQLAFIEYSFDEGETWEVMSQLTPSSTWDLRHIYLDAFSGQDAINPVWIAFHSDNAGAWASGWAVDNVKIYAPSSITDYTDFNVLLDDSLLSVTPDTFYNYAPLNYGQRYLAAVSVNYPYGISKQDTFSFTSRYLPPPHNLSAFDGQSDVTLHWEPPVAGTFRSAPDSLLLPENILGYNIYRDNIFMDYKTHSGGYEPQVYIDSNIDPGHYTYDVSGVYDLTIYGFQGDTGESMRSGTVAVTVDYCNEMPFSEHWDSGNFTQNGWTPDGPGWDIDSGNGNPMPCAVFSPDSTIENYSSFLLSYPFCGDSLSEGSMWLDYDISLLSNQPTGLEILQADIWNWNSQDWTTLMEYTNLNGNIAWTSEHININPQALKKIFKIRFLAKGANSGDISKWSLDNISIYRECGSPTDLATEVVPAGPSVILNWNAPETSSIDQWIHWDNGVNSGISVGTGSAVEFDVAARWEPVHLADLEGASVYEIAFFPVETNCTYSIRVWTGSGNLIYDQLVDNPVVGQWNPIQLNNPVLINTAEELWAGFHVNTQTGYPAGIDNGPAIDGYGNLINFGGWQTLLQINPDMNYNWNIKAHVITLDGKRVSLVNGDEAGSDNGNPRDLSGYNIYRRIDAGDFQLIGFTDDTTYTDTDLANALYCYKVSSVWIGESDQCESDLTEEVCEIMNVGVPGQESSPPTFNLYPNPADDHAFITTSSNLKHIAVYNENGQLVMDEAITGQEYILKTSTFNNGIYLVRVKTAAGMVTRVLTIQR